MAAAGMAPVSIGTVLALLLGLSPAGAAASGPAVDGSAGDRASAMWHFAPDAPGAGHTFAFAEVFRAVNNTSAPGVAVVGLGTCVTIDTNGDGAAHEMCRGAGFGHKLSPGEFELSPLLDTASLDIVELGERHRVAWRASGLAPSVAPAYGVGAGGGAAGAKVVRQAAADGQIFGLDLNLAASTIASVNRGGGMGAGPGRAATTDASGVSRWFDGDGVLHLAFERP